MRKNVLSTPEFRQYAKKNLVLVDEDFPRHKQQSAEQKEANKALAEKYNIEGYPTVIVLSSNGRQLSEKVGYGGQSAKSFIADLQKLKPTS